MQQEQRVYELGGSVEQDMLYSLYEGVKQMKTWSGIYPRILVGGDMNARVGGLVEGLCDNFTSKRGRDVYNIMNGQGLHLLNGTSSPLNGAPTFMNKQG